MTFDKTIQRPHVKKEKEKKYYSPVNYGINIDLDKLRKDLNDIKSFTEIDFLMHNNDIQDMLSHRNIHCFKMITRRYKNTAVIIEKKRNTWRKVTINGKDAYSLYKELKKIY